jgi:hypothetical protein
VPDNSPSRPRGGATISRAFIAQVQRVAWFWFFAIVAAAAVVTASATQIAAPVWLLIPAGRVSAPALLGLQPWGFILFGWIWALALAVAIMANGQLARPDRTVPMIVLIAIAALGSFYLGALVTSAVLQLGRSVPTAAAAAHLLGAPVQLVGVLALVVSALSLFLVPAIVARKG